MKYFAAISRSTGFIKFVIKTANEAEALAAAKRWHRHFDRQMKLGEITEGEFNSLVADHTVEITREEAETIDLFRFSFYVLWWDKTWTLEHLDVDCCGQVAQDAQINLARITMADRYSSDEEFIAVGPLYGMEPKQPATKGATDESNRSG